MIKVMLAAKADVNKIEYPCAVSAKLDGVRATVQEVSGKIVVLARSGKPVPNKFVQSVLARKDYIGFDGELIVGSPTARDVYQKTVSGVMSIKGKPQFYFYVFDFIDNVTNPFEKRYEDLECRVLESIVNHKDKTRIVMVRQIIATKEDDLLAVERDLLNKGYEGVIVRKISAPYKQGRSTMKEGYLLKVKRFSDSEAEIVGYEEQLHNANEAFENELGYTAHTTHKQNMIPTGVLGALKVRDCETGVDFSVGSGFTAADRESLWACKEDLIGKIIKYKFFSVGVKDKPRFPTFLGFRDKVDM